MNPQDPTIQPLNHQAPAPMAPPPPPPPAPYAPPSAHDQQSQQAQHVEPHHDPLGLSAHIPQPHNHVGTTGHAPAAQAPDHLPHIAPVTASNRPILVTLSVAALFVGLLGTFVLYFTNVSTKSRIASAEESIKELNARLDTAPLSDTNKKLTIINTALAGYKTSVVGKLNYQSFFDMLPKQTPKDMRISSLSIDGEGAVQMTATGTSFDTAGKSLLSFAQMKGLTDVTLENISLAGSEAQKLVSFNLSAKLDKSKLLVDPKTTGQ